MFLRRFQRTRAAAAMMAFTFLLPGGLSSRAQTGTFHPLELRALYLYNFAKFTTWPKAAFTSREAPLVLGILGDDPFGDHIRIIEGKEVQGRKLEVRRYEGLQNIARCHILFVAESEKSSLPRILEELEGASVLTVANEMERFLERGGMINLLVKNQRLTFEVDQVTVERAGIRLDSRLLSLASRVVTPSGERIRE